MPELFGQIGSPGASADDVLPYVTGR